MIWCGFGGNAGGLFVQQAASTRGNRAGDGVQARVRLAHDPVPLLLSTVGQRYTETKAPPASVAAVSYAFVEDVAASWEQYERVAAGFTGRTPKGLLVHAAGRTDEGVRIIEVWESEAAWRLFAASAERFADAPRYLREFTPTRLVIAATGLETPTQ